MVVLGAEQIALSDTLVDHDSVFVNYPDVRSIFLANQLCDTLFITNIASTDPAFSPSISSAVILPFDSVQVDITFLPTAKQAYTGRLLIQNSNQDTSISLLGVGVGVPAIQSRPDSLIFNLNGCLDSATQILTLLNQGDGPLFWSLASEFLAEDDFEQGINNGLWSGISNGTIGTGCGVAQGTGALYFNGNGLREAETRDYVMSQGSFVSFDLTIGFGSSPCENVDGGEDIALEYSTNGGLTWTRINTYFQSDTRFQGFGRAVELMPPRAISASTRFRWRQLSNSGAGFDNWALDNVEILSSSNSSSLFVQVQPDTGRVADQDSQLVQVFVRTNQLANGSYPFVLVIQSNDPASPIISVPGRVSVSGQPVVSINSQGSTICFGDSV
jgi:hypothetical protein